MMTFFVVCFLIIVFGIMVNICISSIKGAIKSIKKMNKSIQDAKQKNI